MMHLNMTLEAVNKAATAAMNSYETEFNEWRESKIDQKMRQFNLLKWRRLNRDEAEKKIQTLKTMVWQVETPLDYGDSLAGLDPLALAIAGNFSQAQRLTKLDPKIESVQLGVREYNLLQPFL